MADGAEVLPGDRVARFGLTDISLLGMAVIWGLNFIVVKTTLAEVQPLAFVSVRFLLGAVVLFAVARLTGGFRIPRRDWWRVGLSGVVGTAIYQPIFITGLSLTRASNSALIVAVTPAFIVLLNRLLGRERFTTRGWTGILLSFAGLALVVQSGGDLSGDPRVLLGDLLILAGTVFWSVYSVITAPLLKTYSSLSVTALSITVGTVPLVLIAVPSLLAQDWAAVSVQGWLGLGYSAIFAIVIAYVIWNLGVQRIGGARTAMYNNLTPVVATLAAAVFLGEQLTPVKVAGAAVIFAGLFLARTANVIVEPEA